MTEPTALAQLRHLYQNMVNGAVRDAASAKRIAEGLLAPAIEALERGTPPAAPGEPMQEFEKWLATYSTLSAARDENGYTDMTTEMLWHTWQAATKTKAPGGASDVVIDASARPDLPVVDRRTKQQMTAEVLRRMQQQEDGHNKNPFRSLLDRLMRNEGGYSTIEIGQLKYALDGFYGAARAPADSVLEDAARYRCIRRGQHWSAIDGIGNELRAEALDTAIDAALSAQGGKKGGNDAK